MQRITSHSVRTFSECEPRLVFAPKTCASQLQPHEILRLSRSQCLLTAFLRNPVTFKGVDWKKQFQTQQLLELYMWAEKRESLQPSQWAGWDKSLCGGGKFSVAQGVQQLCFQSLVSVSLWEVSDLNTAVSFRERGSVASGSCLD